MDAMHSPEDDVDFYLETLARRLRRLRRQSGRTLQELATEAGISVGYLSRIERMDRSPSIGALLSVAHALGVHLQDLFEEPSRIRDAVRISRADPGDFPLQDESGIRYRSFAVGLEERGVNAIHARVPPNSERHERQLPSHPGSEEIYVVKGLVQVLVGKDVHDLDPGDSILFRSDIPHDVLSRNAGTAEVLILGIEDETTLLRARMGS